jgi:S1-C subfamily serine protease
MKQLRDVFGIWLPGSLVSLSLIMGAVSARAEQGEAVFKQAPAYTVQIRTVVEMPFRGDIKSSALGAGFVVDAERGWVMTNAHVSARSPSQVRIAFRGGAYKAARKVYVDPYLDLAILQLSDEQREGLTAAKLDCGEMPSMGHPVGAFGYPWGLYYTGTRGIISGVTAQIGGEMLQTDAPINGGNSGGPLISLETGAVVGINTSSIASEQDQNTNFATPMRYACRVLELLQAGQDPSPPKLSTVFLKDLDDLGELVVAETYLGRKTIGLKAGDLIRGVVGVPGEIHNEGQLVHALRGHLDPVGLEIVRDGKDVTVSGRLLPVGEVTARRGVYVSGVLFAPAGFRDNEELRVEQPLIVHSVEHGSLGQSMQIQKWDVLVKVDGKPVQGLEDLHERVRAAKQADRSVTLVLRRWSGARDQVYDYVERTLAIEEFQLVGGNQAERLARK